MRLQIMRKQSYQSIKKEMQKIELDTFIPPEEKEEKLKYLQLELDKHYTENTPAELPIKPMTKKFIYEFIKEYCPATSNVNFDNKQIDVFDGFMRKVTQAVLDRPDLLGCLIEQAYGIRAEDQKQFFKSVSNVTKQFNPLSSQKLLNDLVEALNNMMEKIKMFSNSDNPMDIAATSQMLKNLEGHLKILVPVSKIAQSNEDASEKLKLARIKELEGEKKSTTKIQNQYNIIQIDASVKERFRQEIDGQINDRTHFEQ